MVYTREQELLLFRVFLTELKVLQIINIYFVYHIREYWIEVRVKSTILCIILFIRASFEESKVEATQYF